MIYADSATCQKQLNDIEAIDYFLASQIIQELGLQEEAVLFHLLIALQWALRQGHSCLPLLEVADKTFWTDEDNNQIGYAFPAVQELQQSLEGLAISVEDNAPIVLDQQALYLRRYWQYEVEVAQSIAQRMNLSPLSEQEQLKAKTIFSQLFKHVPLNNDIDWQKVAVANALGRQLSIISGGPGTGKTYTVTRLLASLQAVHDGQLTLLMSAPTGKAAQRLKESIVSAKEDLKTNNVDEFIVNSIPEEATTLHRLLGFRPQSLKLSYNEKHPLKCDVLLIDEVSMIDLPMMARVLRALPLEARLILLGDADQLPSVETGNVLADIVCRDHPGYQSGAVTQISTISGQSVLENNSSHYSHLTLLTQSRRFGGEIGALAIEVISAQAQQSWQRLKKNEQQSTHFEQQKSSELTYLSDALYETWLSQSCKHYFLKISMAENLNDAFSALSVFRILLPTRIGERGVEHLNHIIEQQLRRNNKAISPAGHYKGRPIMVVQNSYASNLFNGDVGLIWPDANGKLMAWFEQENGQYRHISLARLPGIETVYAMTIHKTQGSEFNHVAIVLPQQTMSILSPELLYTGLTRAKEHLTIIGSEAVWKSALNERSWRYSGLRTRLK
ncbi:MAG: exodeoxyribonuclease V subunit alpha [Thiotrichaceae bacterium]|nr:exodeoxyribonuclease V subunit alpha [Thiotrichaceae bacterium]